MESLFKIPPPTFRRYQKSRRYSVRLPEPDSDLLIALARDRREPPATTLIILVQAALAALPKREASNEVDLEMARVAGARQALNLASRMVREHAVVEREIAATWRTEADSLGVDENHRRACLSRDSILVGAADRLDELAAYIEAGDSSRE